MARKNSPSRDNEYIRISEAETLYMASADLKNIFPSKFDTTLPARKLAEMHGIPSMQMVDVYLKMATDAPLDREEVAVWEKMTHPTFLDIPDNFSSWLLMQNIRIQLESSTDRPIFASGEWIDFITYSLPQSLLRRTVHEMGITSNTLNEHDPDIARHTIASLLAMANPSNFVVDGIAYQTADGHPYDNKDAMEPAPFLEIIPTALQNLNVECTPQIFEEITGRTCKITGSLVDKLRKVKPEDITTSRILAHKLQKMIGNLTPSQKAAITPITVFNLLFEEDRTKQITDPILYVRTQQLMSEDTSRTAGIGTNSLSSLKTLVRKYVPNDADHEANPASLTYAWLNTTAPRHAPPNNTLFINILKQIDKRALPIFCTQDLADRMNKNAFVRGGKYPHKQLIDFLYTPNAPQKMWCSAPASNEIVPSNMLRALATALGCSSAEELLPKPVRPVIERAVTLETAVLPSVTTRTPKPDQNQITNLNPDQVLESAMGLLSDRHVTLNYQTQHQVLAQALSHPEAALNRKDGTLSLPHMWLMWAAYPETVNLGIKETFEAFHQKWNLGGKNNSDFSKSLKSSFAWAASVMMRDTGHLFLNNQAVIDFASTKLSSQQSPVTSPNFDKIIYLADKPALGNADRDFALQTLSWLEAGADGLLFGARQPVRVLTRKLKNCAGPANE